MTDQRDQLSDFMQLERVRALAIGNRWVELCTDKGFPPEIEPEREEQRVALMVLGWSLLYEPLNLAVLLEFPDHDFAHDVGGIMKGDTLQSARCATVYHPRTHQMPGPVQ